MATVESTYLPITHHGRLEIVNALCQLAFRRHVAVRALDDALASLEDDFLSGRYVYADVLWRSALRRADELSRAYTPEIGCRSLRA